MFRFQVIGCFLCSFLAAFAQKVAGQEKEVRQLRSKNQQQDDEDSQLLDQVTAQITDATQKTKIKRQTLQDNEARIARLQHQVMTANSSSLPAYC